MYAHLSFFLDILNQEESYSQRFTNLVVIALDITPHQHDHNFDHTWILMWQLLLILALNIIPRQHDYKSGHKWIHHVATPLNSFPS